MNKMVVVIGTALTVLTVLAEEGPKSVREIVERETGGTMIVRRKKSKAVYYVNAQKRAPERIILAAREKMDRVLNTPIDYTNGVFDIKGPKIYGELSLYVIDDENLPMSLVAPEGRWGFVNVAPLAKGRGENPVFFEARVKKEMARIGSMVLGGIGSSYPGNILRLMTDADGLDKIENDKLPVDAIQQCAGNLMAIGVRPWRTISYRKACMDGIAPEPTNDVQRAVWKAVHEMPRKPLQLEKPIK